MEVGAAPVYGDVPILIYILLVSKDVRRSYPVDIWTEIGIVRSGPLSETARQGAWLVLFESQGDLLYLSIYLCIFLELQGPHLRVLTLMSFRKQYNLRNRFICRTLDNLELQDILSDF